MLKPCAAVPLIYFEGALLPGKSSTFFCWGQAQALTSSHLDPVVWCRDAPVPQDKMIRPEDIAQAALLPFRMSPYACPTDIVVRPAQKLS